MTKGIYFQIFDLQPLSLNLKNYFPLQLFAAKKILLFLLVFSYTFCISCKKQDFRPPENENDIALQQVRDGKDSQSLATEYL